MLSLTPEHLQGCLSDRFDRNLVDVFLIAKPSGLFGQWPDIFGSPDENNVITEMPSAAARCPGPVSFETSNLHWDSAGIRVFI